MYSTPVHSIGQVDEPAGVMEHSLPREADSYSVCYGIAHFLLNLNVHYHLHKSTLCYLDVI
jgi:hypothetical protein